jgi:hypothetical protein
MNILDFRFLDVPGLTNSLSFDYVTNSSTQSVAITWVGANEDRASSGEFTIQGSLDTDYTYFGTKFINDFDIMETEFTLTPNDNALSYGIQHNYSDISNLVVNNWNSSFTYSLDTEAEQVLTTNNQYCITLLSNPSAGDDTSFVYYPSFPALTTPETITLSFTGSTPSTSGEILIGGGTTSTYDNLEFYFNQWYNQKGEFKTSFSTAYGPSASTYSFCISAINVSSLVSVTSSGIAISAKSDQVPTDTYVTSDVLLRSPQFAYSPSSTDYKKARETFKFNSNPTNGNILNFSFNVSGTLIVFVSKTFATSQGSIPDAEYVLIGGSTSATVTNLLTSLNTYNFNVDVPVVYSVDGFGTTLYTDILMTLAQTLSVYTFFSGTPVTISGPVFNNLDSSYDSCTFEVRVWEGVVSDIPTTADWSVTKQLISDDQTRLYLDFTKLSKIDFRQYIASYVGGASVTHSPVKMAKWIEVTRENKLFGVITDTVKSIHLGLDGWTPTTTHSVPKVLLSGIIAIDSNEDKVKRYYHKDSLKRIFYKTDEHYGYSIVVGNLNSTTILDMGGLSTTTTQYIRSFNIPTVNGSSEDLGNQLTFSIDYYTGKYTTIEIQYYEDCRYPLVDVIFKNRYGVLETLSMGKVSRKNLKVKKDDYLRSVVDINGSIDTTLHSNTDFSVNGKDEWILNTGMIPEYMNDPIEDMFLSDEIYLYDTYLDSDRNDIGQISKLVTSNLRPVILKDSNFNRKRGYSDGPGDYTFRFESSHEKINNLL